MNNRNLNETTQPERQLIDVISGLDNIPAKLAAIEAFLENALPSMLPCQIIEKLLIVHKNELNETALKKQINDLYEKSLEVAAKSLYCTSQQLFSGFPIPSRQTIVNDSKFMEKYVNNPYYLNHVDYTINCTNHIVLEVLAQTTPALKLLVVKRWISLLKSCLIFHDFHTAALIQVALGFSHVEQVIQNLHESDRNFVDSTRVFLLEDKYKHMNKAFTHELTDKIHSHGKDFNIQSIKSLLKVNKDLAFIPYMGAISRNCAVASDSAGLADNGSCDLIAINLEGGEMDDAFLSALPIRSDSAYVYCNQTRAITDKDGKTETKLVRELYYFTKKREENEDGTQQVTNHLQKIDISDAMSNLFYAELEPTDVARTLSKNQLQAITLITNHSQKNTDLNLENYAEMQKFHRDQVNQVKIENLQSSEAAIVQGNNNTFDILNLKNKNIVLCAKIKTNNVLSKEKYQQNIEAELEILDTSNNQNQPVTLPYVKKLDQLIESELYIDVVDALHSPIERDNNNNSTLDLDITKATLTTSDIDKLTILFSRSIDKFELPVPELDLKQLQKLLKTSSAELKLRSPRSPHQGQQSPRSPHQGQQSPRSPHQGQQSPRSEPARSPRDWSPRDAIKLRNRASSFIMGTMNPLSPDFFKIHTLVESEGPSPTRDKGKEKVIASTSGQLNKNNNSTSVADAVTPVAPAISQANRPNQMEAEIAPVSHQASHDRPMVARKPSKRAIQANPIPVSVAKVAPPKLTSRLDRRRPIKKSEHSKRNDPSTIFQSYSSSFHLFRTEIIATATAHKSETQRPRTGSGSKGNDSHKLTRELSHQLRESKMSKDKDHKSADKSPKRKERSRAPKR